MTISIDDDFKNQTQFTPDKKERFNMEAAASWRSYKSTGLHLRVEEVQAWLNTWGTDKESEIPKCHK